MDPYVNEAREFALWAHGSIGQTYDDLPYEVHLAEVVALVASVPHTKEMLAAAWNHDVLEDVRAITREAMAAKLGPVATGLVVEVTSVSSKADGPRAVRAARDRMHFAAASAQGQTIKLADLTANLRRAARLSPGFAKVYIPEKALLLPLLTAGDATLRRLATEALQAALAHWNLTLPEQSA